MSNRGHNNWEQLGVNLKQESKWRQGSYEEKNLLVKINTERMSKTKELGIPIRS
jgi:hypothetical protein